MKKKALRALVESKGFRRLEQLLVGAGYKHHLLSATPHTNRQRGHDIAAWLARHPGYAPFAIVDDDCDMAHLLPRLVQTRFHDDGLTREHGTRLIALLKEPREVLHAK